MRRTLILILVLSWSAAGPSNGEVDETSVGATLESTRAFTLSSSSIEQEYRVQVAVPYGYESSDREYPVLYLLDSDVLFGLVTDVVRLLPLEGVPVFLGRQRVPELIVVGIGYPGGVAEMSKKRDRDLNPPGGETGEINPDGAADFHRFLSTDLIPRIEATYRTQPGDRTLLGVSRGGVFVLGTLFRHPESFQRYIAMSPVIEPAIWDHLEAFSARAERPPARLFLSAGSAGEVESGIASGVSQLRERLTGSKVAELDWDFEGFEGETHVSVVPRALVEALLFVFSEPQVSAQRESEIAPEE